MQNKSFTRYRSNVCDDSHTYLQQPATDQPPKMDYFDSIRRLLAAANKDLPPEQFHSDLTQVVTEYLPGVELILKGMEDMQLGTSSRYSSPKRKLQADAEAPPSIFLRRTWNEADKEEAQTNLTYTYQPMEEDATKDVIS